MGSKKGEIMIKIIAAIVIIFLIVPVFIIIPLSFNGADYLCFPPKGFSMKWYQEFFGDSQWVKALTKSLKVAISTTVVSLVLGTMAAEGLRKIQWKGKSILQEFFMMPLYIPVIILAIAIYNFESGVHLTSSFPGLVLAHCVLAIPYVVSTMSASLNGINQNIENAALNLGASGFRVFFEITLPMIRPAIVSSAIFAFVTSFDELIISMFICGVSGTTLPKKIWDCVRSEIDPTITAIAAIVIIVLTVVMLINTLTGSKEKR